MASINLDSIRIFLRAFFIDYKHHVKVIFVSMMIMTVSSLNYFVGPYYYDILVTPYRDAKYNYMYMIDSLTGIFVINKTALNTPIKLEREFKNYLDTSGIPYNDLVVVTYTSYNYLTIYVITNYSKLYLTVYNSLVAGRHISNIHEAQVPTAVEIIWDYPNLGDVFRLDGVEYKVVGQHKYEEGIVIPYSSELNDIIDIDITQSYIYVDFNNNIRHPEMIFYGFLKYLWARSLLSPNPNISMDINQTMEYFRTEALNSTVSSKENVLNHNLALYNSEYNNPASSMFIVVYGAIIIFVLYFMKSIDTLFNINREYMALLYSIGGTDMYFVIIYSIIFMVYTVAMIPLTILLSYLYIIYGLRIDIPVNYFINLIYPLHLYTIVATYVTVLISTYWNMRRRGFADILFERFLG